VRSGEQLLRTGGETNYSFCWFSFFFSSFEGFVSFGGGFDFFVSGGGCCLGAFS
jgi:hypothetical protein